jgi:alkylation response protein AidB-like acyl-CoA dehydrogenase
MDLTFTEAEEEFRHEARTWLEANIPSTPLKSMDTPDGFEEHREWERTLHSGRWSVVSWPEKYGGRDCSLIEWLIFEEEYYRSGAPGRVSSNGVTLLGPTLFAFGTEEQKDRFLPKMASGDEIWAQGWSEPNAGSDLASLKTKAIRDGEWFVVNGQKTWCSRGAFADWIFCIFRTDPEAQRHKGLTYFLVPADTEGMTRREVGRLDGEPGFAELFFDNARVHESNILGGEGAGWNVAMATASSERGLNLRSPGRFAAPAERAVELFQRLSAERDERRGDIHPGLRDEVVRNWIGAQAYRWYTYYTAARLMDGGHMGPEASLMKVFWSQLDVEIHATALRMAGDRGELMAGAPDAVDGGAWMDGYQFALSGPIYAGTNEIQRNIIAERVLGLPR